MRIYDKLKKDWDKIMAVCLILLACIIIIFETFTPLIEDKIGYFLALILIALSPLPWLIYQVIHQTTELKTTVDVFKSELDQPGIQ